MKIRLSLLALSLACILCTGLSASPIFGTFNIAGTIIVTPSTITWTGNDAPFPPDKARIGPGPTDSFTGLGGTTVTINDLGPEPVGPTFPPIPFISFDAAPLLPVLDLNQIFAGIYGTAQCLLPPAVGQQCTPSFPVTPTPVSPFNFVNNPGPVGPQATATFVFSGVTSDGLSRWFANFTAQFGVPYQSVLTDLGTNGFVSNTYSATVTVTPLPEPDGVTMMGIGLGLVAFSLRLRRKPQRP